MYDTVLHCIEDHLSREYVTAYAYQSSSLFKRYRQARNTLTSIPFPLSYVSYDAYKGMS